MTAEHILDELISYFPGLLDGDTEVCGSELIAVLTQLLQRWDRKETVNG